MTRIRPDVVTFWHGPLDALRRLCLRSQVAAGHNVTVYSFDPLAGLPDGVGNAEAEAILPHAFSERLRPSEPDGTWRDWTTLQFSDFFRMRLMARKAGLWLDADVLLLKPVEIDLAKPYFAWERPRQLDTTEFDRIAGELRVSPGDLNELVHLGVHAADELPNMLKALGIDREALARTQPLVLRDMERVCALCHEKGECDRDLAAGTAAEHYQGYCPNAPTISELNKSVN